MKINESMLGFLINMFNTGCPRQVRVEDDKVETKTADPETLIKFFCYGRVPRKTFLLKYKKLDQRIDQMDAKEKTELKSYVNDLFKGETPQFRLEACQIIFTLNQCL